MPQKANALRRHELKRDFAKDLRKNATDAEKKLWSLLRNKQLGQLRFRRQQPIGPYIADFYCAAVKLIVELDGSQHADTAATIYDEARTQYLNACGYRVLRFWNTDVLKNSEAVLDKIWSAISCSGKPLPDPAARSAAGSTLPQGEGEG